MSYKIIYEKPAIKFLQRQSADVQKRLVSAIHKLPTEGDIKPLRGLSNEFRLRVGSFRVIFSVKENLLIVHILTIGNRGDIYKKQ